MVNKKHLILILLGSIILLGSLLRFHRLSYQSFWDDESNTWYSSNKNNIMDVISNSRDEINPPLYFVLTQLVIKHIGHSEAILRMPSAIFGVFSIIAIYLLGRRIYSYKEGLIASGLMAVLERPIYYSQEARAYSALILFSILSVYFLIPIAKSLKKRSKIQLVPVFGYISSGLILAYLHHFGSFLVILQSLGILLLMRDLEQIKKTLAIYLIILIGYLPWTPYLIVQFTRNRQGTLWIAKPGAFSFISYLNYFFNDSMTVGLFVIVMYLLLLIFWLFEKSKSHKFNFDATLYLFLWLFIPVTIIYLQSTIFFSLWVFRYLLISLPAAYLLLARSITILPLRNVSKAVISSVMICLFLYHLLFSAQYYQKIQKAQWREAVHYLKSNETIYKNSFIMISTPVVYFNIDIKAGISKPHPLPLYYFKELDPYKCDPYDNKAKCVDLNYIKDLSYKGLKRFLRDKKARYLSVIIDDQVPLNGYMEALKRRFKLIAYKEFEGVSTYIFDTL